MKNDTLHDCLGLSPFILSNARSKLGSRSPQQERACPSTSALVDAPTYSAPGRGSRPQQPTQPQRARALLRRFHCDVIEAAPKARERASRLRQEFALKWKGGKEHLRTALRTQPRLTRWQGEGFQLDSTLLRPSGSQPRDYATPQLLLS